MREHSGEPRGAEPIATRTLFVETDGGSVAMPVRIYAPEEGSLSWRCRIEIDWPDGSEAKHSQGHDSVQALDLAMRLVGVLLYASCHHEEGRLTWDRRNGGYGFPITANLRDLLVGDDAKYM